MKPVLALMTALVFLGLSFAPALAAETVAPDEFGSNFREESPQALQDGIGFFSAEEELGNIEPSAGGDSLFLLPGDDETAIESASDRLTAPETPLVPGMEQPAPAIRP